MAKLTVTLTANAGLCLQLGQRSIWIDALHSQQVLGFSALDTALQSQILEENALGTPSLLVYTHCHPDHFSRTLTQKAMEIYPDAPVLLPEQQFDRQITLAGESFLYEMGDIQLFFQKLPHEGAQYAGCPHYGCLISWQNKHILLPGDCRIESPELAQWVKDIPIDLAVLNFPWLTLKKGKSFVETVIQPRQTVLCHLPFAKDDGNGYLTAAKNAAAGQERVRILDTPLQPITLEI